MREKRKKENQGLTVKERVSKLLASTLSSSPSSDDEDEPKGLFDNNFDESKKELEVAEVFSLHAWEEPGRKRTSFLTTKDLRKDFFGPLDPFVEDYQEQTREQFDYVPIRKTKKPLTYQQTILAEDPVETEDFEKPFHNTNRKGSLICESVSTDDDSASDWDELYPNSIYWPKRRKKKQEAKAPAPPPPSFVNEMLQALKQRLSSSYDDLPPGFVPLVLLFGVLLILVLSGPVIGMHFSMVATCFATGLFMELRDRFAKFVPTKEKLSEKVAYVSEMTVLTKEQDSERSWKDVSAQDDEMTEVRHIVTAERAHVNEARVVKTVARRPFIQVSFADGKKRLALIDSGSSSCVIHPKFLEHIREHSDKYIPVEDAGINVEGVVRGSKAHVKTAYLDLTIETGYTVPRIPFLVMENRYGVIIGSNLVQAQRWGSTWKNDEFYIQIGPTKKVKTQFDPPPTLYSTTSNVAFVDELTAVSEYETTLMPHKKTMISLQVPEKVIVETNGERPSFFIFPKGNEKFVSTEKADQHLATAPDGPVAHVSSVEVGGDRATSKEEGGVVLTPSCSRLSQRGSLFVEITNKSDFPMVIPQGIEIAEIQQVEKEAKVFSLDVYQQASHIFRNIPRISQIDCHCQPLPCDESEMIIFIEITDTLGCTSTGEYVGVDWHSSEYLKTPGFSIVKHFEDSPPVGTKALTILITPHEIQNFCFLTDTDFVFAQSEVQKILDKLQKKPLYFFLDPLFQINVDTEIMIANTFLYFPFTFMPVRHKENHPLCIRPALRGFPMQLLTGVVQTHVHIQLGHGCPPADLMQREVQFPLYISQIHTGHFQVFRQGSLLICVLHVPLVEGDRMVYSHFQNKMILAFFNELRYLRIPWDTKVSLDGFCPYTGERLSRSRITEEFEKLLNYVPHLWKENLRCSWPYRQAENKNVTVPSLIPDCKCAFCINEGLGPSAPEMCVFKGDLSKRMARNITAQVAELKVSPILLKCSYCGKAPRTVEGQAMTYEQVYANKGICETCPTIEQIEQNRSKNKSIYPQCLKTFPIADKALICEFTGLGEEDDMQMPLDIMGLADETELQEYINEIPETAFDDLRIQEEENSPNLPPVVKTSPELYKGFDLEGIPDQFRPGDWRNTDIMSRLDDVSEQTKKAFGDLLDKHVNTLSYYPSDGRPIILDGKPVEVDLKLITDKPIFLKPYPITGRMVQVLDDKLDELISRKEIIPIESKYNMPILLTHHNSENKHTDFKDKKWRLVVDNRVINSLMEDKNLYSFLVRGVDHLFTKLQGAKFITTMDCVRAYRSLTASKFTQMATAFRTPSSIKYPHVTWTFRSTSDGIASLPGIYSLCIQQALSPRSKACTAAHIDDLICFSPTEEQHLLDLDSVLTDLGKGNFLISVKKLQPFKREVQFLGHMIDGKHVWIPESRIAYFDSLQLPRTKKELQSILGMGNYVAPHIDSYMMIAGPLYDPLKGRSEKGPLTLNEVQIKAFQQLKESIKSAEKLHLLDTSRTIYMECDASLCGVGSVLYHESIDENGKVKRDIVRYGSRRHSLTEALHHTSLEREAMAILISAKQHMYFLSSCPECVIKTDLKSLITILSCYNCPESARMARLSHRLYSLPFKWSLVHTPGVSLPLADGLSRIYPPYVNAFSDRHLRYPDLKRENIKLPDDWYEGKLLTTTDILKAMYDQIIFIEKSSDAVKEKRLKALVHEIGVMYDLLKQENQRIDDLKDLALTKITHLQTAKVSALTAVSEKVLITPDYVAKKQNENEKISKILLMLRTLPVDKIPKKVLTRYRVLNDSILVTRKNKELRFDEPGNLRIVCDAAMSLYILSIIHVMSSHLGQNTLKHLFSNTYKTIEGSAQGFVKLVCTGCRACRFHRPTHRKAIPQGRIPLPNQPNDTWMIDFMVFEANQTFEGKKVAAAFNIIDLFSNLLISCLCPDQTHKTVIRWLKFIFSFVQPPRKIVSDNAKQLCKHPDVLNFLKSSGVSIVTTTTPYHSSANKVERMHKLLREVVQLSQETFHRDSQFEMYFKAVWAINSRPLTLALHPHVKEVLKPGENPVVTPFSLHYGNEPRRHFNIDLEDITPEERGVYRHRWRKIIKHYDKSLEQDLQERIKSFKGLGLEEGDLVLVQNIAGHKEQLKYYKNIYEIIKVEKARFFCAPLFPKGRILEVNGNHLKPYTYSEMYDLLPTEIKNLMGENLSPEELKSRIGGDQKPLDFTDWKFWRMPQPMALRKRLAPASVASVPALQIRSSEMSSEAESGSTIFTIPDQFPDFLSEATTLVDPDKLRQTLLGTPSLKMTKHGLEKVTNTLSWKKKKSSSIYLQSVNVKDLETAHAKKLKKQEIKEKVRQTKLKRPSSDPGVVADRKITVTVASNTKAKANSDTAVPDSKLPVTKPTADEPEKVSKKITKAHSDDNVRPYTPTNIIVVGDDKPKPLHSILKKNDPAELKVEAGKGSPPKPDNKDQVKVEQQVPVAVGVAPTGLGVAATRPITRALAKQIQQPVPPAAGAVPVVQQPIPPATVNQNVRNPDVVTDATKSAGKQQGKVVTNKDENVVDQANARREATKVSDDAKLPIPAKSTDKVKDSSKATKNSKVETKKDIDGHIADPSGPEAQVNTVPGPTVRPRRVIIPPKRYQQ